MKSYFDKARVKVLFLIFFRCLNELIVVTVKHPHDGSPGAERRQNLYQGTATPTPLSEGGISYLLLFDISLITCWLSVKTRLSSTYIYSGTS